MEVGRRKEIGRESWRKSSNELEAAGTNYKQGSARLKFGKSHSWLVAAPKAYTSFEKQRGGKDVRGLLDRGESGHETRKGLKTPCVKNKQDSAGVNFARSHSWTGVAGAPPLARTKNGSKSVRLPDGRESQRRKAGNGVPRSSLPRGSSGGSCAKSHAVRMRASGTSNSSQERGSGSAQRFESRRAADDITLGSGLRGSLIARKSKLQNELLCTPRTAAAAGEEEADQWMWERFDSLMMSLKDFFKDRTYKPRTSSTFGGSASLAALLLAMSATKANPGRLQGPLGNLSTLYFKYGTPDVITLRC